MSNPRVTGAIRYAQDVEFEDMLYASILRSSFPSARVVNVDTSAVPPSVVVLTPDDIRELGTYGCQIKDQTVLALDRVRFVGDPVIAVAAATFISSVICGALTSNAPRNMPGKQRTLLIWLG